MKRLLPLFLAALLLTGCAGEEYPGGAPEETVPPGIYDPDSAIEAQTGGAIRAYPLEDGGYTWIASMGDSLLLGGDASGTVLTVLTGENCQVVATSTAASTLTSGGVGFSATDFGVGYYSRANGVVVFLNKLLQEKNRYQIPADIQGIPSVNGETEEIYYCIGPDLKGFDPQTGITRLIKTQAGQTQTLVGSYFGGRVLACRLTDQQGSEKLLYISTETGQTLSTDENITALHTYGDSYFACRTDGLVTQQIFGTLEAPTGQVNTDGALIPVLPMNGAVEYSGGSLSFYDLTTGKRSASVELEGVEDVKGFLGDGRKKCVWFLGIDTETGKQVLYRWNPARSQVFAATVYTSPLYTLQSPDTEGLAQCQAKADALNEKYGVDIKLWQDVTLSGDGHTIVPEHQVTAIDRMLDELEPVLALFPEGFLDESADTLCIDLARSISRGHAAVRHWAGGDAHIVLTAGSDIKEGFLRNIGYVVDAHVLGNTVAYDYWNENNPDDFSYDYDYAANALRQDTAYLEGEEKAFADKLAMSFPSEDRNSLFYNAMLENNADCFSAPYMQKKLEYMCDAIRRAYGLRGDPTVFPWEQYLTE